MLASSSREAQRCQIVPIEERQANGLIGWSGWTGSRSGLVGRCRSRLRATVLVSLEMGSLALGVSVRR